MKEILLSAINIKHRNVILLNFIWY